MIFRIFINLFANNGKKKLYVSIMLTFSYLTPSILLYIWSGMFVLHEFYFIYVEQEYSSW